jgi:Bacterial antitoxin of type II TA system, VapB
MKKTLEIDAELLAEAKTAIGATTDTATIRAGLEALVRHAAYQRLAALLGTWPDITVPPRHKRQPDIARTKHPRRKRSAA